MAKSRFTGKHYLFSVRSHLFKGKSNALAPPIGQCQKPRGKSASRPTLREEFTQSAGEELSMNRNDPFLAVYFPFSFERSIVESSSSWIHTTVFGWFSKIVQFYDGNGSRRK